MEACGSACIRGGAGEKSVLRACKDAGADGSRASCAAVVVVVGESGGESTDRGLAVTERCS